MTALALHQPVGGDVRRYGTAALVIVLLHAALMTAVLLWDRPVQLAGVTPAIYIDLAPAPTASQLAPTPDVAPGPEMQEAEAPPPEPPKPELFEQLPPAPVQPEPLVAAPPKVEPKPEPKPIKPQPVHEQVKKPTKKPPAPRTTAPPKAERVAPDAPSATSGASAAAASASYAAILNAHLARFKQAPSGAGANERGTAHIQFTVSRNGRVTARGLARSSGFPVLDRAALDLLQRAQPLPAFLPDMRESSKSFVVPVHYK